MISKLNQSCSAVDYAEYPVAEIKKLYLRSLECREKHLQVEALKEKNAVLQVELEKLQVFIAQQSLSNG